jgi:hypothetical protein
MATRSTIAMSVPEGVRAIYCHWDGYPEGVGQTLKDNYSEAIAVSNLLDRGDLSGLGDTPEESVAYSDRGEQLKIHTFNSTDEWIDWAKGSGCEYAYYFEGDNIWKTEMI